MKFSFYSLMAWTALTAAVACGDTVVLKDGSVHEGTITRQTPDVVQLRVDDNGIRATMNISMADVAKITTGAMPPPAAAPAPQSTPPVANTGDGAPAAPKTMPAFQLPPLHGFLYELAATTARHGPDDPARLPPELHELWDTAVRRQVLNNRIETLAALQQLDDAFSPLKGGAERLDGISRRERGEPFGSWLARVHWDAVVARYNGGQYDLKDIRESERRPLIGILKEKTGPALEPLHAYFPPLDDKTGKPEPFKSTQLQGITPANAVDVKKQAAYASAILLAQMKLEPQMAMADRVLLSSELQTVGRILSCATELEPAAKAAIEKAARDKRIAEEKARHPGT